jgi:hypothetical protein
LLFQPERAKIEVEILIPNSSGKTMKHVKKLPLGVFVVLIGLILAQPAYAQESSGVTQQPAGIGILLLLMGLGAIGLVAFVYAVQARPRRSDADDEDDE